MVAIRQRRKTFDMALLTLIFEVLRNLRSYSEAGIHQSSDYMFLRHNKLIARDVMCKSTLCKVHQ